MTAAPIAASPNVPSPAPALNIVQLRDAPLALYAGGVAGLAATMPAARGELRLDPNSAASRAYLDHLAGRHRDVLAAVASALGRAAQPTFEYRVAFNGLALALTDAEAATVRALPGVASVQRDEQLELLTDNGPRWMDADAVWDGTATGVASKGEGIVAGIIDTGVNVDHPSFADLGGDGFNHTNPRLVHFGACAPLNPVLCNDKLIGLYDFTGTTPFDDVGHGSHTASTVAGNVVSATVYAPTTSVARSISGVAPHANVISYKACTATVFPVVGSCPLTALVAAIDQATIDQVDVINFSIGGASANPWADPLGLSFLGATSAGTFVAASAGNSGPFASTVGRPANSPWLLAVGASTHDRRTRGSVLLSGVAGAPPEIVGMTVSSGTGVLPIVDAASLGNNLCNPFTPAQALAIGGKVVVCDQGVIGRVAKGQNVKNAGGAGMALISLPEYKNSVVADTHVLPAVHIGAIDGASLRAWLGAGSGHTAQLVGTTIEESPALADRMAGFSSRGPDANLTDVIKPDVTAPGVAIFAAFNAHPGPAPAGAAEYNVIQGTSMSSPHAAGAGALIRALHPGWTPDQVKSALMTTGFIAPNGGREVVPVTKEDHTTPADPFDMGGGRIDLARAARAGLILDESPADYQAANPALGGDPKTLNVPSMGNGNCAVTCSWTRTLTSATTKKVTWNVSSTGPLTVSVSSFSLDPGASRAISVIADLSALPANVWHFGQVTLTPNDPAIPAAHLPVAARTKQAAVTQPRLTLHFHGNVHDGCTGDGATDVTFCDGPFLTEDGRLDTNPVAARWVSTTGLNDGIDRSLIDPNWVWKLNEPTTLSGPMTVEWWTSCTTCLLGADWRIGLWADGARVFPDQRVTLVGAPPASPSKLEVTVQVPEVTANTSFVLELDPVFTDVQQGTQIHYDSTAACPGGSVAPCDSIVQMPVKLLPDLAVGTTDITWTNVKESTILHATVHNIGTADASNVGVRFLIDGAQLGSDQAIASIPAGGAGTASVNWNTKHVKGDHVVTVIADPTDAIEEKTNSNNEASRTLTVQGNRVRNGSFETASPSGTPEGWSSSGGTTYNSDPNLATDGTRSVSVIGTGSPVGGSWTSGPIAVTPGESIYVSVDVRAAGASSVPSLAVNFLAAGGALSTLSLAEGLASSLSGTASVPAGVTTITVTLSGFAATDLATAGTVTFDDVFVR